MAPNLFGTTSATLFLEASQGIDQEKKTTTLTSNDPKSSVSSQQHPHESADQSTPTYKWNIVWRNVIAFAYLHLSVFYGFYLTYVYSAYGTLLFAVLTAMISAMGITAGAHRLWAHRAYKAKWPLRFILMILQTLAFQNHIFEWVRDHRVHHKFTDTDADPHNAKRGFFFSHIGWLMLRKHPDVIKKGATVDMSDLEEDPIVVWQRRLYIVLMPLICFFIPTWIPCYLWNERPIVAWYLCITRYTIALNITWLVNSAAHIWGMKPYDSSISPTDNFKVALWAFGEGWHNYHHVFPWDYKTAELGEYKANLSTAFIDFFAWVGWAYDLKTVPLEMVTKRAARTGDGSRMPNNGEHSHEGAIWGWGDADMHDEDIRDAQIINKSD